MKSLNPHLAFTGNAREAICFYRDVFGGELKLFPVGDRNHLGLPADAVFHADLEGPNFRIMAADAPSAGPGRVSLHVVCEDREEIERLLAELSQGGTVHCALGQAFGGLFSMVEDRFGIGWFLTLPDQAER